MFWTNWNEQAPSIMRASLNGANVIVIIGSDIKTPNGLAIDHRAEKLYFSDATLDKIERCEYDGSNRYVRQRFPFCLLFFELSLKHGLAPRVYGITPAVFYASGAAEKRARPSVRSCCVRRLHLLDWLGEEGCPQSWQVHWRRHESAACWHPSATNGHRCCS